MAKFWITSPRYMQQVGQSEPEYVFASPGHPVLVDVPDTFKPDPSMRPAEKPPEKLKPAHAEKTTVMRRTDGTTVKRAGEA